MRSRPPICHNASPPPPRKRSKGIPNFQYRWREGILALTTTILTTACAPVVPTPTAPTPTAPHPVVAPSIASNPTAPTLTVAPDVAETINVQYYPITGSTAVELRNSINLNRRAATQTDYDARADWYVRWNYRYAPVGDRCQITALDVTFTGTIIMPQWQPPVGANPQLVQQWQQYATRLRAHEDQHIQHGRDAAATVKAELPQVSTLNCAQIEAATNGRGEAIVAEYAQKDKDYDARTNHGETEGVRFP